MQLDELREAGIVYFASGSNAVGEILGLHDMGVDVGVAVPELGEDALYALLGLAGTGRRVFVDSGAFSEVRFGPKGPTWPHPITDDEWERRLEVYLQLAERLGDQVYLVAPDRVADQHGTFVRQATWAPTIWELRRWDANVLVPLQKGELTLAEAQRVSADVLGFDEFIPAIPMKKDATKLDELIEYLREAQPERVHLLGLGAKAKKLEAVLGAVTQASPGTQVFLDAVLIRSMVGRKEGIRRLTAEQDVVRGQLDPFGGDDGADYTDLIGAPDEWLTGTNLRRTADELGLRGAEKKLFLESPKSWLEEHADLEAVVEPVLDAAWQRYWEQSRAPTAVKRRGIRRVLAGSPLPVEDEDRYMFEGTRTSAEDWEPELEELFAVLPDDPEWPLGRYVVSEGEAGRVVDRLDGLELWERIDGDEDTLTWETVNASLRQRDVQVVLVLRGQLVARGDGRRQLCLRVEPELRRGGVPLAGGGVADVRDDDVEGGSEW